MNKTVTIGLPLPNISEYSTDVSWDTRRCLVDLKNFSAQKGITTVEMPWRSVNVAMNHTQCANNMKGEWLLVVGSDHMIGPDALLRLLEAAYGLEETPDYKEEEIPGEPVRKIIGAICPFRNPPYRYVAANFNKYKNRLYPIVPGVDFHPGMMLAGQLLQVDAVGSGVCLYHRSVFDTVPYPWFTYAPMEGWIEPIGPDFRLCIDAAQYGIKTFVHFGVTSLHMTWAPVDHGLYIKYLRSSNEAKYVEATHGRPMTEETIQALKAMDVSMYHQGPEELEQQHAESRGTEVAEGVQETPSEGAEGERRRLRLRDDEEAGMETQEEEVTGV